MIAGEGSAQRGAALILLAVGILAAVVIRVALLPAPGLVGDVNQFVVWVQAIATGGLSRAYDQNISFPPVMVYVWSVLAAIEPAFRLAVDSSDPWLRSLMKVPASVADLGLAAGVGYALRERPAWAVAGTLGIALHPAIVDVSAWWGQYESLYVLPALVAYLLAVRGRPELAVVLLSIALMTKPQALPFAVPFAAWFLARHGWRGSIRLATIGAAVVLLLWLPFLPHGGPLAYLGNLAVYQGDIFAILSLGAWNPWWLFQEAFAGGLYVLDNARILGPITLRMVGLGLAGIGAVIVFRAVYRAPTARTLALGLAAITLLSFTLLTTMHERYAYGALVFLALLLPDRRALAVWLVFGVAYTLNLLAVIPPTPEIGDVLSAMGPLGIVGSVTITGCTAAVVWLLLRSAERPEAERVDRDQPVPDLRAEPLPSLPTNAVRYQPR